MLKGLDWIGGGCGNGNDSSEWASTDAAERTSLVSAKSIRKQQYRAYRDMFPSALAVVLTGRGSRR